MDLLRPFPYFDYSNKESFKKEIQLKINEKNQDIAIEKR